MQFIHEVSDGKGSVDVTVDFVGEEEKYLFPELYKLDKLNRVSWWRIYVIGSQYFRQSGITGGKVKEYAPVTATVKNHGKTNETTPDEQALLEAYSSWKHKQDQLYSRLKPSEVTFDPMRYRPMLAEKFTERKHKIVYPCGASPKLDGVRCLLFHCGDEKEITIISRLGTVYKFMEKIRTEATMLMNKFESEVVLDGEIYSHNLPFNAVSGAARAKNKASAYDGALELHIFDLFFPSSPGMHYRERMEHLRKASKKGKFSSVKFVFFDEIAEEKDISPLHTKFVEQGYEGLILRNLDAKYHMGRTTDLQKYKEFEDKEFEIVDVVEGEGTEKGAAIFVCTSPGGEFRVRPRGSIERRRKQFNQKEKFRGKMLTVRYQPMKGDLLPRFPVGIKFDAKTELIGVEVRDYE